MSYWFEAERKRCDQGRGVDSSRMDQNQWTLLYIFLLPLVHFITISSITSMTWIQLGCSIHKPNCFSHRTLLLSLFSSSCVKWVLMPFMSKFSFPGLMFLIFLFYVDFAWFETSTMKLVRKFTFTFTLWILRPRFSMSDIGIVSDNDGDEIIGDMSETCQRYPESSRWAIFGSLYLVPPSNSVFL